MGFMNRLSGLFVSLAFLLLASLFGFESGDNPGLQPGNAARFLMTVFPFVMMVISIVFSFFMKFRKVDEEIPPTSDQVELDKVMEG
jgi:GPH family glycoside/pentoside/hexuronide:cation symporter